MTSPSSLRIPVWTEVFHCQIFSESISPNLCHCENGTDEPVVTTDRAVGTGEGGTRRPSPPDYDRSLNPISSRAADYASHNTICPPPPEFLDLSTALTIQFDVHVVSCYRTSIETWHATQLIPKWLGRFLLRGM